MTDVEELWPLPVGWSWSTFQQVAQVASNLVDPAASPNAPHIAPNHIESGTGKLLPYSTIANDKVMSPKHRFYPGQILYSKIRPYLCKAVRVDFEGLCSADMYPISTSLDAGYLHRWMLTSTFTELASNHDTRTLLPKINQEALARLAVPVPPLAEQSRIVAAVEVVLAKVSLACERLERVSTTMKRFRQAVLAAACSGLLTADWRDSAKQPTPSERFRADVLRARDAAIGGRNGKAPAEADNDYLEELPPGWALFSLEELTTVITSGSRDWTKYYGSGTGTFIMAQNVRPGTLDLSTRQQVGPPANNRDAIRSQVATGDLLVTIVGANTGDLCPVDRALPEHYVCQSVALLRPVDVQMSPYLNLYFNSTAFGRGQFNRYIYGEGRPHLGFDQIKMSAVALPPLAEQQEIVRRVSALFALADSFEQRAASALKRVESLTQAVLAKAFRGELVLTEAELARREKRTYETADELLARIRATTAAVAKPKRARKATG